MKKVLSVVIAVCVLIVSFAGCTAISEKLIVGEWTANTSILGVSTKTTYLFNEDGTGSISTVMGIEIAVDYTIDEETLIIITDTPALQKTFKYTYEFEDDTLVLTDTDGVRLVLTPVI
ncbi:MAG: hypothetical protein IKB88_02020 [Clostridia bacterium]|nr:hypothetical protein [Clostridia bacterium]